MGRQSEFYMTYEELIARALGERSARAFAAEHRISKGSMHRYASGTHVPDYRTAAILAEEANITLGEIMEILIAKERELKGSKEIFAEGFRLLTSAVNRLFSRAATA
jgi:hypothetical protein